MSMSKNQFQLNSALQIQLLTVQKISSFCFVNENVWIPKWAFNWNDVQNSIWELCTYTRNEADWLNYDLNLGHCYKSC